MIAGGIVTSSNVNTPSIMSSATALAANPARLGWHIQNLGQNPLFICIGSTASTTQFHVVLHAAGANDDGSGGSYSQAEGIVSQLIVTVAGTSPRYTVMEIAP